MMMKRYFVWIVFLFAWGSQALAQEIWMTRSGEITFFSETPVEDIEAENKAVTCIFKSNTGALAFSVLMQSFDFERAAMQDHFNDEYLHTEEFPKAIFNGNIIDYAGIDVLENGKYEVDVTGDLTIHGITNAVGHSGIMEVLDGKILLNTSFNILLPDYNVKIPSNYLKRISDEIEITVNAVLEPYER